MIRLSRSCLLISIVAVLVSCGGGDDDGDAQRSAGPIGYGGLVGGSAIEILKEGVTAHQLSSYDRSGDNLDFGGGPTGNSVLYEEGGRFFIFDEAGPGMMTRLWMTHFQTPAAILDPSVLDGDLRVEVDGMVVAQELLRDYFAGPFPLVSPPDRSGGGYTSYRQIAYRTRLRISTSNPLNYYHIGFYRIAADVYDEWSAQYGALDATGAALDLGSPMRPPEGDRAATSEPLAPGERTLLFDVAGSGRIVALRAQLPPAFSDDKLGPWIEITFDGAAGPQVAAPLSFFFGVPEGGTVDSPPVVAREDGARAIYFPMPFERSATIRLENRSEATTLPAASWSIATESLSADAPWGHLHTRFQVSRVEADDPGDVLVAEAAGQGHLVGTVMVKGCDVDCTFIGNFGHLEGDERIYVDGGRAPDFHGTGTEDYFNSGFYYLGGPYGLPTHGLTAIAAGPDDEGIVNRYAVYRWHLTDPIPFGRELRFDIEHGPTNDVPVRFESLVFLYLDPAPSWTGPIDVLDLSDAASREAHGYSAGATVAELESTFPTPTSPRLTAQVHYADGPVSFRVGVASARRGLRLRRLFDAAAGGQAGRVFVDDNEVGLWLDADSNRIARWAESELEIPPDLVSDRETVEIRIEPTGNVPFSAARYEVFAYASE